MPQQNPPDTLAALSLLELVPDGVFLSDSSGRYTAINDAACRLLKATRAEILGKTAYDFIHKIDADMLRSLEMQLRSSGETRFEWMLRRLDGSSIPIEVFSRLLPDGQRVSTIRDISERRQREQELQRERETLQGLQAISDKYLSGQGDDAILAAILDRAIAQSGADCGYIQSLEPQATALRIVAARGLSQEFLDRWSSVAIEDGVSGVAFKQQSSVVVADLESSEFFVDDKTQQVHRRAGVRAMQSTPLFSRAGEPIGAIATYYKTMRSLSADELQRLFLLARHAADIIEHRSTDRKLRAAEALSSGILAVSADAIICFDLQRRITQWNASAEKMFGYSQAEALKMQLEQLLPADKREVHREHVARFVAESSKGRRMSHSDAFGRRKSGETFLVDVTISRLDTRDSTILTASVRDISAQKRIENEQRTLAELGGILGSLDYKDTLQLTLKIAVARLADFAVLFVREEPGNELHRVAATARDPELAWAAELMMELPNNPLPSHPVWRVLDEQRPLLMDLDPEQYEKVAQSPEHLRALQAAKPRSTLIVPLAIAGKCLGALGMSRGAGRFDAQDLHLAEVVAQRCTLFLENVRLLRAERRATRARDEVLEIVAHDLRNPLNAITLRLQLMLRRSIESNVWQESAKNIQDICQRMNRLIQDLLDVNRIEAGAVSMTLELVVPEQLVAEALEMQEPLAAAAHCKLRSDVTAGLPAVLADRRRMLQVFQNLIGNAIKFTPAGGQITVGATANDRAVEFRVSDTGVGIQAEHLKNLFERFWQADRTDRRGVGLGLAIAKKITEAHGGRIWVQSAPGRGTTFFVSIPFSPAP